MNNLSGILSFIKEAEGLKNVSRTAWTSEGKQESTAEHSWRLALMALSLERYFPKVNMNKVLKMCLIHDLGELYEGDISAKLVQDEKHKFSREEKAMKKLAEPLCTESSQELLNLWKEYNQCTTEEAKLVKALDKLETIIQHNQGINPENFDYEFNLKYGYKYCEYNEALMELRKLVDEETVSRINR